RVNRLVPTVMLGASNIKAVAGGSYHTLALTAGGKVLATGYNVYGQLGDGTVATRAHLAPVKNAALITAIAAGSDDSVLLKPSTRVLATGYNAQGQLGIGSAVIQKNTPVLTKSGNNILAISIGPSGSHSLLLKADGSVWACGYNKYGQLGQGTTTD